MKKQKTKPLEFTGERFTPECVREIWYEHYHRYAFAQNLVAGKNVLDIASGEGYGSAILANKARSVIGMDIDSASIAHAQNKYQHQNLHYQQASCLDIPLDNESIDVIVSFETLEHLAEHEQMLAEFNRVLKTDGILLISTPDKKHYSDATGFSNEYHVKELYKQEFKELLDKHWQQQIWYAQALSFNSLMQKLDKQSKTYSSDVLQDNKLLHEQQLIKSMYYIVIVGKQKASLPTLPDLHLFADTQQSVYQHYNQSIKNEIAYGKELMMYREKFKRLLSIPFIGKVIKFFDK